MLTLFVRGFKSVFRNIKSVIALSLMTLVWGILFVVNNIATGYSEIEPVLPRMALVAALAVPLVAIFSVYREKRDGSATFISTLPFTRMQVLLGKFFAILVSCLIPVGIAAGYPLALALMGAKNVLGSYLALLMLCFFIALLCAFGLMLAYLFKRVWVAMIVAYSTLVLLFLLGTVAIIFESSALIALIFFIALSVALGVCFALATKRLSLGATISLCGIAASLVAFFAFKNILVNSISGFFRLVSPFRRYDATAFGIFDLSSVAFYLSITVVLLWITASLMRKSDRVKGQKRRPVSMRVSVASAIVLLVCLTLNVVAVALPVSVTQIDVSDNKLYSVSQSTKAYLKSLDKDVTVYMIDKSGADEIVVRFIERYCSQGSKLTLREIDAQSAPEFLKEYGIEASELPHCSLIVESEARWRIVSAEEFFTYYHEQMGYMSPSNLEYYIEYYSQMYSQYANYVSAEELKQLEEIIYSLSYESTLCFCAESSITQAVEYVCAEYIPAIYFATGHGEKNSTANPLDIRGLSKIPKNVGLLIINAPDVDYTNSEIATLLDFAERGGRMAFIVNKANQTMPNIARLLDCYGLSLESGVIDEGKTKAISNTSGSAAVSVVGASAIKIATVANITVEPLLTADVKVEAEDGSSKTEKKTVAAVAYKNQQPVCALITGADTFNISTSEDMSEEDRNEYLVAMSFLQSVSTGMKKSFSSSLSFGSPKLYGTGVLSIGNANAAIWGILFVGVAPLALFGIPAVNIYSRKRRGR